MDASLSWLPIFNIIYGSYTSEKHSKEQEYSGGDTIGCYVDTVNEKCCFTKNGILRNKLIHLTNMREDLYPTIAIASNETVLNVSFGKKKFVFDTEGINFKLNDYVFLIN